MFTSLDGKSYEERLASLNLFSFEKYWLQGKLIVRFNIFKHLMNMDANKLFPIGNSSRTRGNSEKQRYKQVQLDSTKFFFSNDMVIK